MRQRRGARFIFAQIPDISRNFAAIFVFCLAIWYGIVYNSPNAKK